MAKKISSSDLFSQEDLFKGVRDSAQSALVMINQLNAAMKTSAEGLKASIKGADLGSASGLKGFNQAASEANQLKEEAIRLEIMQKKLTAEMEAAEKSRITTERERLKLENDLAKAAARAAKTDADKDSAYKALVKSTRDLKNASKELAAQLLVLEKSGQSGSDEFQQLSKQYDEVTKSASDADQQLKSIDKSVGDSFRNVGNYEGAVEGMAKGFTSAKAELRALTNEILNMKKGTPEFEAARQRASELKDEIQDLSQELNAGAGNAFEQVSGSARLFGQRLLDLDLKGAGQALSGMGSAVRGIDFKTINQEVGGLAKGLFDLGKAVISNPFFLAAGALTALVVYWKDIEQYISGTATKLKQIEKSSQALERQNIILEGRIAIEKVLNGNSQKAFELDVKRVQNNIQIAENELEVKKLSKDVNGIREAENALLVLRNELNGINVQHEVDRKKIVEDAYKIAYEQRSIEKDAQDAANVYEKERSLKIQERLELESQLRAIELQKNNERKTGVGLLNIESADNKIKAKQNSDIYGLQLKIKKLKQDETALTLAAQKLIKDSLDKTKETAEDTVDEIENTNEANAVRAVKELSLEQELQREKERITRELNRASMDEQAREIEDLEYRMASELAVWEGAEEDKNIIIARYEIERLAIVDKYSKMAYDALLADSERKLKAEEDAQKKKEEDDKKALDAEIQKQKDLNDAVKAGTDLFVQESERKQAQIDKDLDNAKKQYDTLKALADNGNIDAQQSLAEQQRIMDEKERQRMAEMKRQERIKLAQSIFSTYSAKLESGDKNALANTIKDATVLTQFVQSLPAFLKGTEDTGVNGYGVDGKGGFLSVLHPNERVVPKELNSKMSGITNEELAKIAVAYKTNEFMTSIPSFQQADSSELISRIDNLTKVLKDKPETNIALGEIMQGAMEIVQTTKRGNKTVYNRYRVK
jgi:hypothetical protein